MAVNACDDISVLLNSVKRVFILTAVVNGVFEKSRASVRRMTNEYRSLPAARMPPVEIRRSVCEGCALSTIRQTGLVL